MLGSCATDIYSKKDYFAILINFITSKNNCEPYTEPVVRNEK